VFARHRIRGAIVDGIREQHWFGRRAHNTIVHREPGTERAARGWLEEIADSGHVANDTRWNGRRLVQLPIEAENTGQSLAAQLCLLPAREQRLLVLCYFEDKTLNQAAKEMGFCRSWASRLHARALATLRAANGNSAPAPYRRHPQMIAHGRADIDRGSTPP
jgi:RNA polymerase sigma factor (sigma-70 family)